MRTVASLLSPDNQVPSVAFEGPQNNMPPEIMSCIENVENQIKQLIKDIFDGKRSPENLELNLPSRTVRELYTKKLNELYEAGTMLSSVHGSFIGNVYLIGGDLYDPETRKVS